MKEIDNNQKNYKSNKSSIFFSMLPFNYKEELISLHKSINSIILALSIAIFLLAIVGITTGLNFILHKNESRIRYIEEDGIKYIELVDGYIKEELVVETGTILPELKNYFRDDYKLPKDLTVQYFENNNVLNLEQFTYEKDGDYYLKGIRTINVIIFGDYEYQTKLSIIDTTSPTVTLKEISIPANEELDLNSFVETYIDNSGINEYSVQFKEEYDLSKEGTYDVTLLVCDISNNCNEGTTKITITKAENNNSNNGNSGSGNKPSSSNNKPNTNTPKPNSGSNSNSNGNNTPPKSKIFSFDASNVITPEYRNCPVENNTFDDYNLVINHYGTTETIHFGHIEYTVNSNCRYIINNYQYMGYPTISYALNNFNGTAKTMLEEAMYIYNTKNDPQSGYQTSLDNFLKYTNEARKEAGLNEVELNYHLCILATMRAIEINYSGIAYEQHFRPNGTLWTTLWDEYGLSIPSGRSENIAFNQKSDKKAFEALMNSEGHRKAILTGMYTKMGIGKFTFNNRTYYVQIFST